MSMDLQQRHQYQYQQQLQHDNLWISAARLPYPTSVSAAPWETRHRQELALREALCFTYANIPRSAFENDDSQRVLESEDMSLRKPQLQESAFELTSVREANLVSRCLYALQGIPVAVKELKALAKLFLCQVADRSSHRLPSLWKRSSSTKALGELLLAVVQAGWLRCQLEEFVNFFMNSKSQGTSIRQLQSEYQADSMKVNKSKKKNKGCQNVKITNEEDLSLSPPYSLVNQAFSKAVKSILQGHLAALNTLTDSVLHRRSGDGSHSATGTYHDDDSGAIVGLPVCDITLLELHLHTQVLRVQLQALASVCLQKRPAETEGFRECSENGGCPEDEKVADFAFFSDSEAIDFSSFPRGADLLTFLYRKLQEADNVHIELLRYLFSCACQPYLVFVHSWLYRATLRDPYKEFVVHEATSMTNARSRSQVKISVFTPCFLEGMCDALVRSGQQLQVLLKLVEGGVSHSTSSTTNFSSNGFRMLESALKAWTDIANESSVFFPSLVFNKNMLDKLVAERKQRRHNLMKQFDLLFSNHPLQSDGREFQEDSSIVSQPDAPSVLLDTDVAALEHFSDQNASGNSLLPILHGNPSNVASQEASLSASEAMTNELSDSAFHNKESFEPETEEAKQKHEGSNLNLARRQSVESEDTIGIETGDWPFAWKRKIRSKHRKQWIEPTEVIILHGQPDEDLSHEDLLAEEDSTFRETMQYVCDSELEAGTADTKLAQGKNDELSICEFAKFYPYNIPTAMETNSQLKMEYTCQVSSPSLQTLTMSKDHNIGCASIFFSNISLEEVGPELFSRPFMHKLAQHYKNVNLPQSDRYKKNVANFDAVSQKLWNFEDCICDSNSNIKILPSQLFTRASGVVEMLDLDNKSMSMVHSEPLSKAEEEQTDLHHASRSNQNPSNFSRATTLCDLYVERSITMPSIEYRAETPLETLKEEKMPEILHNNFKNSQGTVCSGGAIWQSYLGLRGCEEIETTSTFGMDQEVSEVPLEVIIEKCIIQEILSQYQCISHFTVRLLHEVFDLQGHLSALRRYYFMERGDWADIFTSALYRNIWHLKGHLERQLEVQLLLEAAVQNSSCQDDDYAERLHVSVGVEKEDSQSPTYDFGYDHSFKSSGCAFNFITLGYHLEWPVSLVITPESLKLYNSIFHFLIRVKLAAHAAIDIWRFSKDLLYAWRKHGISKNQEAINTLILFRQQMDHFVTTLQGHLETQLLHNVWQKFLLAIHHEGKDLLDLERIHGLYLQDAQHVCFLSEETKSVKTLIDTMMQYLLDLSICLNLFGKHENGKATIDSLRVKSAIDEAKNGFDLSIQQLLHIALNWQNHFVLSQFWMRLDFNGFFGSMCSTYS